MPVKAPSVTLCFFIFSFSFFYSLSLSLSLSPTDQRSDLNFRRPSHDENSPSATCAFAAPRSLASRPSPQFFPFGNLLHASHKCWLSFSRSQIAPAHIQHITLHIARSLLARFSPHRQSLHPNSTPSSRSIDPSANSSSPACDARQESRDSAHRFCCFP